MALKLDDNNTAVRIEAEEETPLMEGDHVPEVYADGAGKVEIIGENVRITYFARKRIGGVRVRVPVLEMVRPLKSCGCGETRRLIDLALLAESGGAPRH